MHIDAEAAARLFEAEIELESRELARLLELLEDEQRVLTQHEDELLQGLAAQKAQRIAAVARLEQRRHSFLLEQGYSPDAEGMLAWLSQHPLCEAAERCWHRIQALAQAAREVNEINGGLIDSQMQRFRNRLAFIGAAASNDPSFGPYTPDGYAGAAAAAQRSFGEA
jgi:flagellar biosynthesis/type III secretory pathway chaperone